MISESIRHAAIVRLVRRIAAVSFVALTTGNFLCGLMEPFEYTTASYTGWVRDADFDMAIESTTITLDENGPAALSDKNGAFSFGSVRTGAHTFQLTRNDYESDTATIDLTIDPEPDTFFLTRKNVAPSITRFEAFPKQMLSCEDTVRFFFEAWDSTGGITGVAIESDTGRFLEKTWSDAPLTIKDSLRFGYGAPGARTIRLCVTGIRADTSRDSIPLTVPSNRRPRFSLIRFAPDGFINGEWGFIEIYADDPDSNFHYLTITWGDTSKTEKSFDIAGAHWHRYNFPNDTAVIITVGLFDSMGANRDTTLKVQPRNSSAPILDDRIIFDPSQYLAPNDTSVMIGVKIIEIDSMYVPEIVWLINQNDPASAQSARKTYTPETGKISEVGDVFAQAFPTEKLKATNIVQIIVRDRLGKTSTVTGSLYKVGI
jgi:hypothetical protein